MEHSALHALQLAGLLLALGGPVFVLGVLRPACRALGPNAARDQLAAALATSTARWACYGALAAALGSLADLVVATAELQGRTAFAGVDLGLVGRFAAHTSVGRLGVVCAGLLLLTAAVARVSFRWRWEALAILALAAIAATSLVSHAGAQPAGRSGAIATQAAHLCAAAAWLGVLLHWLLARRLLETSTRPACIALTAKIVRRFSPFAFGAVSLLVLSGLFAAHRFVGEPAALVTSPYGLTLLVKLTLLGLALYAGSVNFRIVRPALLKLSRDSAEDASPNRQALLRRFGRTLELEVTAGLLVVTMAGIVGSISPPGPPGIQRLTAAQAGGLRWPHLPRTAFVDPETFYGAATRTLADLRYSESMHNCSGLAVCLLGLLWLAQSVGGKPGASIGRFWPLLLVPFGVFIGVASDPEIWLLRRLSVSQVISDPQLLDHRMGVALVFLLAGLAWRDGRRPASRRPLGYALPGIMIFGSLLLLAHAHSTLNTSDELTNLINVQHAIFGALGLFAGTVRWLSLRGLFPPRLAAWLWPSLVLGLGLFMAFGYREVT